MQDKKLLITPQISMLNEIKFVKPHKFVGGTPSLEQLNRG